MTDEERRKAEEEAEALRKAEEAKRQRDAAANKSPRANIRLKRVNPEGEREAVYADPPTVEGEVYPPDGKPIMLPRIEDQRAGFYHPAAARIIALYPDRYIVVVEKGGK